MAKSRRTLFQQLNDLIEQFTPEIRDAFRAAIAGIVNRAVLADVIKAVENGDANAAFRALGFSDAAMRPLTAIIERAFETGGIIAASTFPQRLMSPSGRVLFQFDIRNSRAEAWLRDHSSRLVVNLQTDALTAIQNVLHDGMAAGRNPRSVALDIVGRINPVTGRREGGIVGLTPQQERWVKNTREDLESLDDRYLTRQLRDKRYDKMVEKAIETDTPLDADTIDRLVSRYKDNALVYRGETIARTEAIQSLNRSADEAFRQVVDTGAVKASAVKRIWDSTGDSRTRDTHLEMDGQEVGLNESFVTPGLVSYRLMFPGDTTLDAPPEETINCRCRVRIKVDWLADLD